MNNRKWTDTDLIQAIKGTSSQRDDAYSYIYNLSGWRNSARAFITSSKSGGNDQDAEDIFQDAVQEFDKEIRKDSFRGDGSLKTFFLKILKNKWIDKYNKQKRRSDLLNKTPLMRADSIATPEQDIISQEKEALLLAKMEATGARCKEIWMLVSQGFDQTEISELLNIKGGAEAVKKIKNRCRGYFLRDTNDNSKND
jgi:RNA polymerase sigma factor (sigma-70 family)